MPLLWSLAARLDLGEALQPLEPAQHRDLAAVEGCVLHEQVV
jgi:hypothetical protein